MRRGRRGVLFGDKIVGTVFTGFRNETIYHQCCCGGTSAFSCLIQT